MTPRLASTLAAMLLLGGAMAACAGGPVVSSASPPPTGAPTPAPSPVDGAANLTARFLEAIDAPDATFRAVQTTTVATGEVRVTQVITSEVDGADAHLAIIISREGAEPSNSELVVVDGKAFARQAGGDWQSSTAGADIAAVGRTFSFLEAGTLRGLGRELRGGSYVDHLVLKQPVAIDQAVRDTFAMGVGEGTIQSLSLWLHADGTPTSLEVAMAFEIPSTTGTEPTSVRAVIVQEFADFGGDVTLDVQGLP